MIVKKFRDELLFSMRLKKYKFEDITFTNNIHQLAINNRVQDFKDGEELEAFLKVNFVNHLYSSEPILIEDTSLKVLDQMESQIINETKVR